ncbi:MAG: hypothetical protein QM817_15295 [Archangium sp.]
MIAPPPFPTSLEQLAAWQVWADQRIEAGDKLGALISADLALGTNPSAERLVAFRHFARSVLRIPRVFEGVWFLGHVRHLAVKVRGGARLVRGARPVIDGGELLTLRDTLSTAALANLESLELTVRPDGLSRRWREAAARLPPTCRTLVLHADTYASGDAELLLSRLPASLVRLRLVPGWMPVLEEFVSDRLEVLDLRSVRLTESRAKQLASFMHATRRVRLVLGDVSTALEDLGPRISVGEPGDARLIDDSSGSIRLLERSPGWALQRRFGVISALAQLERRVPEIWGVGTNAQAIGWAGDTFTRHVDGSWSVRQRPTAHESFPAVLVDGAPPAEQIVPLANGARVVIEGKAWRFSSAQRAG